jgi:phosphoribosyl-AMP cyclohydrolase
VVVAIDTRRTPQGDVVHIHGGRTPTDKITQDWARQVTELGAGEILLTSMDHDGTKNGFALEITRELSEKLPIPVVASGGAGTLAHFTDVFREGKADAALAASIFLFGEIPIQALKQYLKDNGNRGTYMNIDFEKNGGLVPAIIQDETTAKVLMLGYMNRESYEKTLATGRVTFYSRSRQTLWTKGESSGNFLEVRTITTDCDNVTC